MERGATHYTHWFQPLTGLTAEKHDSFYAPDRRRHRDRRVLGQGADPGRARRVLVPDRRHPRDLRGARLHGVGPDLAGLHPREPERRAASASRPPSRRGRARRSTTRSRCCARWTRCRSTARARAAAVRRRGVHARLHDGRPRAGVLPDRRAVLLRAPRPLHDRPHAVRRQAAQGPRARRPLLRLDPRARPRLHARDRAASWPGSACRSRPATTRSRPAQYELAPIFENSNVGSDHQQLTMQVMQNVARRYGLVCLLHEKPFAGVNGSGKHNNWSMGTDTGDNLLEPGDTPHENIQFLFFCAAVIQAVNKHQALLRASVANVGQDHRLGANEAPPAIISIFLGAELEKVFDAIESGRGRRGDAAERTSSWAPRCCRRCRCTAATATGPRRSPSPATSSSSARSGRRMSLALPNTVLNTIVAEAIDELADDLESGRRRRRVARGGRARRRQGRLRGQQADRLRRRQLLRRRGTPRPSSAGWRTCARRPTRCRGSSSQHRRRCSSKLRGAVASASSSRASRCSSSSTRRSSTSRARPRRRSPAR